MEQVKYRIIRITDLRILDLYRTDFVKLVEIFLKKAKSDSCVDNVLRLIAESIDNPAFRLLLVIDENHVPVGYYILQFQIDIATFKPECFIYQHISKVGLIKEINDEWMEGLKAEGIKIFRFCTRRNSEIFADHLGEGWTVCSTTLEKRVED